MDRRLKFMFIGLGVFCFAAAGAAWYMDYKGFAIFYVILGILDLLLSMRKKPLTFGIQQQPIKKDNPDQKEE